MRFGVILTLLLSSLSFASENDPLSLDQGKEKGFYQELQQLSKRQELDLARYRKETEDLEPEERLRLRRQLMVVQHRELALLEAKWGDKANDQHHRWLQRQEDRRRRLEALRRKADKPRENRPDTTAGLDSAKRAKSTAR